MITKKLAGVLKKLEASSQAENRAVAECLREIASNGGEQAKSAFLAGCADNIISAAAEARDKLIDADKLLDGMYEVWRDAVARGATKSGFADWGFNMYKGGWISKSSKAGGTNGTTS